MNLAPMRFKNYTWPHNPRIYGIEYRKRIASYGVPFGKYLLQNMGRDYRVLKGEGEFAGEGAYDEFKKLATVFYSDEPGILTHPLWQNAKAYFVSLTLKQEPTENYVKYAFEFWECYDDYDRAYGLKEIKESADDHEEETGDAYETYTVVYGDSLWKIAGAYGLSLEQLLALNPQIKNPNLIYPGDIIRVS